MYWGRKQIKGKKVFLRDYKRFSSIRFTTEQKSMIGGTKLTQRGPHNEIPQKGSIRDGTEIRKIKRLFCVWVREKVMSQFWDR